MRYNELPNCCGVFEFGGFYAEDDDGIDRGLTILECKEMFAEIQAVMSRHKDGYYYQAWFVRNNHYDGTFDRHYESAHLATLISKIPGVIKIKPTINPNSGNMIKGYIWKKS